MSSLNEVKRRLHEALEKGRITKEVHDNVLEEAATKQNKEMVELARRLAEPEPRQSKWSESPKPLSENRIERKELRNWCVMGMFATAAAALAFHQMYSHNPRSIFKPKKGKTARKSK